MVNERLLGWGGLEFAPAARRRLGLGIAAAKSREPARGLALDQRPDVHLPIQSLPLVCRSLEMDMHARLLAAGFLAIFFAIELPIHAAAQSEAKESENCLGRLVTAETIQSCANAIASESYDGARLAGAYFNLGLGYFWAGDYVRAIASFDSSIQINPLYASAFNARGIAYAHQQNYSSAIVDYDMSIRLDATSAEAFNNRGLAYDNLHNYPRAIADFDRALELNPESVAAFANRGSSYYNAGNYERAISDLSEALRRNPNIPAALRFRALASLALHNYRSAIDDLNRALQLEPNSAIALNELCLAHAMLQQFEEALSYCDASLKLSNRADTIAHRGIVHLMRGDLEAGLTDFSEALRGDPQATEALYGRGIARLRQGQTAEGQADIATAEAQDAQVSSWFAEFGIMP